ncbi:hypothetical protein D0T49_02970 [Paludibacter sp. 221]|uniref:hypothetical protein n=1 Tax=Paludibacter sp. 221 TaxID=2302939 RepID=UPI0013CFD57B|nr:hypothetical protein [Paludibacter sp. 221]NDV46001.1 hypothetical protein [Paludibacter sp. 221]
MRKTKKLVLFSFMLLSFVGCEKLETPEVECWEFTESAPTGKVSEIESEKEQKSGFTLTGNWMRLIVPMNIAKSDEVGTISPIDNFIASDATNSHQFENTDKIKKLQVEYKISGKIKKTATEYPATISLVIEKADCESEFTTVYQGTKIALTNEEIEFNYTGSLAVEEARKIKVFLMINSISTDSKKTLQYEIVANGGNFLKITDL